MNAPVSILASPLFNPWCANLVRAKLMRVSNSSIRTDDACPLSVRVCVREREVSMAAEAITEVAGASDGFSGSQRGEAMAEFVGDGIRFGESPLLVSTLPVTTQALLWKASQLS